MPKTLESPCEMCWKRPGEGWEGMIVCFGCKSDLSRSINFLHEKGWNLIARLETLVPLVLAHLATANGVEAPQKTS